MDPNYKRAETILNNVKNTLSNIDSGGENITYYNHTFLDHLISSLITAKTLMAIAELNRYN